MKRIFFLSYWEYRVKKTKRDKDKKTIYKNRKVDYLSTYGGLEREGCSWEEKTKIFRYFFKKLTKFLIDRNRLIKRLWTNLG